MSPAALAPTACKLSSQFLVLDHMSNHYTKIAKAKCKQPPLTSCIHSQFFFFFFKFQQVSRQITIKA